MEGSWDFPWERPPVFRLCLIEKFDLYRIFSNGQLFEGIKRITMGWD
jgi:hypothetical protein